MAQFIMTFCQRCGNRQAYIETLALGDELPSMPLFLQPAWYVSAPLEASYQTAYRGVPEYWRGVLEDGGAA